MDQPRKSPQPPLLFFACLLAGWGIGRLHPVELPLSAAWRFGLALSLLLLAAFGFGLDSAWLLGLTLLLVLLLDRLVIAREELRLRAQFGEAYLAYTKRVRRWF